MEAHVYTTALENSFLLLAADFQKPRWTPLQVHVRPECPWEFFAAPASISFIDF